MPAIIPLSQLSSADQLPEHLHVLDRSGSWRISTSEALECISPAAWRYLGGWSIRTGKSVLDLLAPLSIRWDEIPCQSAARWRDAIRLEGELPCGLYGCLCADGTAHT
jgi:hypothetical protein